MNTSKLIKEFKRYGEENSFDWCHHEGEVIDWLSKAVDQFVEELLPEWMEAERGTEVTTAFRLGFNSCLEAIEDNSR